MPRLIDADKAKEVLIDYYHIRTNIQQLAMEEAFSRIPTVDAVPIEWIEEYYTKNYSPYSDTRMIFKDLIWTWEAKNAKID